MRLPNAGGDARAIMWDGRPRPSDWQKRLGHWPTKDYVRLDKEVVRRWVKGVDRRETWGLAAVQGSGFEDVFSVGEADPDGVADEAPVPGIAEPEPVGVAEAPVAGVPEPEPLGVAEAPSFATGAGFCWAESLSAKIPASREAIPAAVLSGNLCIMLS